jgi:AraC-like DNA-binding protein
VVTGIRCALCGGLLVNIAPQVQSHGSHCRIAFQPRVSQSSTDNRIAMGTVIGSLYTASFTMCLFSVGLVRDQHVRRGRALSWLAWFLAVETVSFACEILIAYPDAPLKALWLGLRLGASLFIAPCLWLAVREAAGPKRPRFAELGYGHLAAIGIGVLLTLPVIDDAHLGVTFSHPDRPISLPHARFILGSMLGCIAIFAVQVPMLLWSCRKLLATRAGGASLGWMQMPLLVVATTWAFGLLHTLQCAAHFPLWMVLVSALFEVTVTVGAIYLLLRRVARLVPVEQAVIEVSQTGPEYTAHPKYTRSSLTPAMRDRIQRKLKEVLSTDAVCDDCLLNLRSLCGLINEKAHYVSQVINQDLGTNFYELVNRTRIDRAQRLLIESPERTILEIALSVGYNSKSTFNTAFRRQTGVTPTEYRTGASRAL